MHVAPQLAHQRMKDGLHGNFGTQRGDHLARQLQEHGKQAAAPSLLRRNADPVVSGDVATHIVAVGV
eukprot:CAMPEP_0183366538 /NCGR_PEP_ID=MMETSP0164_2-20130417/89040_1 /TAXON_ID=221442 /ORGANISM="Coccolithus pelagicus ssp braarudi, Strain PLY182g" /LENGTH=66 /DNA_ID=CAMNT_0025542295 /DNA_START=97 /DNA_END=294 /DNA_ORIENTATION=-